MQPKEGLWKEVDDKLTKEVPQTCLCLAGKEGMEKRMETLIMGYIEATIPKPYTL